VNPSTFTRSDLIATFLGSLMLSGYCLLMIMSTETGHAEIRDNTPAHLLAIAPDTQSSENKQNSQTDAFTAEASSDQAQPSTPSATELDLKGFQAVILDEENTPPLPWVKAHQQVPAAALFNEENPAPPYKAKLRSWHNRLLFPTVLCPYCGRRVPTQKGSYFWLLIGFIGQIGFTGRFFVQWVASEKARASVIPESFWWMSILGSAFLLIYSISILAWPIILGQTPNIFIYTRNLYFIHKAKKKSAESNGAAPQS